MSYFISPLAVLICSLVHFRLATLHRYLWAREITVRHLGCFLGNVRWHHVMMDGCNCKSVLLRIHVNFQVGLLKSVTISSGCTAYTCVSRRPHRWLFTIYRANDDCSIFIHNADLLTISVPTHAPHHRLVPVVDHLFVPRTFGWGKTNNSHRIIFEHSFYYIGSCQYDTMSILGNLKSSINMHVFGMWREAGLLSRHRESIQDLHGQALAHLGSEPRNLLVTVQNLGTDCGAVITFV